MARPPESYIHPVNIEGALLSILPRWDDKGSIVPDHRATENVSSQVLFPLIELKQTLKSILKILPCTESEEDLSRPKRHAHPAS